MFFFLLIHHFHKFSIILFRNLFAIIVLVGCQNHSKCTNYLINFAAHSTEAMLVGSVTVFVSVKNRRRAIVTDKQFIFTCLHSKIDVNDNDCLEGHRSYLLVNECTLKIARIACLFIDCLCTAQYISCRI